MVITEKQKQAWNVEHIYLGHGVEGSIKDGLVQCKFNSPCGEYVTKVEFAYNPFEKTERDPDWHLATYTGYKEQPAAHGWMIIGSGDNFLSVEVPQFAHPNDLFRWIKANI